MEIIDIDNWNRKQHYEHFSNLKDPYFGVTIPVDVTNAYQGSKRQTISFFGRYLHDCMKAMNSVEQLRYRIVNDKVIKYSVIHASATIMRPDNTFGFSFIEFDDDLPTFLNNLEQEKQRIFTTNDLFPPKNGVDCIHCSALPWLQFTGHKEPVSGEFESVPKVAFSRVNEMNGKMTMNVAVNVNHALTDGYHLGQFFEKFQDYLNN